ncbi:MAG: hypothetical protein A3I68_02635 [Candidatus Melainabacteria bacterium RIFCSPLOWO2_02_FULL_35_15]|nr:MAG: hypothetical protein A3F80_00245 [Candidatus Melainabacteria bacterium RIFCSPLOWO2_12_FULL_35_11]OGI13028.1 MAG: hypothetical protein A3I68_02635 [Candidatus Melainabacteria bacterium RIFCSPLOWO2_02_FULL_35_15]
MNSPLKKANTSLEGFEQLWEAPESSQSIDSISNQIHAILKVLVDERIALNQEHQLVAELKQHINSLETQIQKLNWQLGQREQELSNLYSEYHETVSKKEALERQVSNQKELVQENTEIRLLAEQLSNQILQEKSKNEQLVELLINLSNPELSRIMKKPGI